MNNEIIKFSDVAVGYGKKVILEHLNFSIEENDFFGIVGPNGCGQNYLAKNFTR